MYKLNFSENMSILNWSSIYWGIKMDFIEMNSAIEYANKFIENNPNEDSQAIIELLITDTTDKNDFMSLLRNIISDDKALKNTEEQSIRIIRYVILKDIQRNAESNQKLLSAIENVYADFDYPADMEQFISYMPVQEIDYDVSEHTQEENEQHLVDKFNIFLDSELDWIKSL